MITYSYYRNSPRNSLEIDASVHLAGSSDTDQEEIQQAHSRVFCRVFINDVGKQSGETDQANGAQPNA